MSSTMRSPLQLRTDEFLRVISQPYYISHVDTRAKLFRILGELSDLKMVRMSSGILPGQLNTYGELIFSAVGKIKDKSFVTKFLKYMFIFFYVNAESVTERDEFLVANILRRNDLVEFDRIFLNSDGVPKWEMLDPHKTYMGRIIFKLHDPENDEITEYLKKYLEQYIDKIFDTRLEGVYQALDERYREQMLGGKRKKRGTRKRSTKLNTI